MRNGNAPPYTGLLSVDGGDRVGFAGLEGFESGTESGTEGDHIRCGLRNGIASLEKLRGGSRCGDGEGFFSVGARSLFDPGPRCVDLRLIDLTGFTDAMGKVPGAEEQHIEPLDCGDFLGIFSTLRRFNLQDDHFLGVGEIDVVLGGDLTVFAIDVATVHRAVAKGKKPACVHHLAGLLRRGNMWNHDRGSVGLEGLDVVRIGALAHPDDCVHIKKFRRPDTVLNLAPVIGNVLVAEPDRVGSRKPRELDNARLRNIHLDAGCDAAFLVFAPDPAAVNALVGVHENEALSEAICYLAIQVTGSKNPPQPEFFLIRRSRCQGRVRGQGDPVRNSRRRRLFNGLTALDLFIGAGKLGAMQSRSFSKLGRTISEIGLGCWQLGGETWGTVTDEAARGILEEASRGGVTFYDTADVYGDGQSERIVGRFLTGHPGMVVATKAGRRGIYPDRITRATLGAALDESLGRLGVGRIDLLQLHCVPTELLRDGEIFGWLAGFRDAGKIAAFGASVETIEEGFLCLRDPGLASLQVIFNLLRQRPAAELLPAARAAGVAVIVRLPLASGLLTDTMTADRKFAVGDHRSFNRDGQAFNVGETFSGLPFEKGVELVNELRGIIPAGSNMALLAQRWILDHPAVTTVITGASRPEQAARNCGASLLPPLPPDLHKALAEFYESRVHQHIRGPY